LIREGLKAPMTEEVALAIDGELVAASTKPPAGNCAGAGVGQATATVVWRYFKSRYSPDLTGGYLALPAGAMHSMRAS
jgi:hypothetical protein